MHTCSLIGLSVLKLPKAMDNICKCACRFGLCNCLKSWIIQCEVGISAFDAVGLSNEVWDLKIGFFSKRIPLVLEAIHIDSRFITMLNN